MTPESQVEYYGLALIIVYFLHWVGDFVLQTREMAENKCQSIKWLTLHVLVYSLTVSVPVAALFGSLFHWKALTWFGANFFFHWLTDFTTSKASAYFYQKGDTKSFFTVIGFDQFIHAATLIMLLSILMY